MAAVEATGLVKRYREVTAVDRVSLRVQPGEVCALLGLNGAGKTTTIRMLLGMVMPTTGSVSVFGMPVRPGQTAVWSRALDPAGVVEIRQLLRELAESHGVAVLLSSHVLAEVARLATRIGILHEGRMVRELAAAELATGLRPRLRVSARDRDAAVGVLREAGLDPQTDGRDGLVLREPSAVQTPDAVAILLVHAGCPPTNLVVEHEDLEAYFLRLVGAGSDD